MGLVRVLDRLDRTLGTAVSRAAGLVFGVLTVGVGRACFSAFAQREWLPAGALLTITLAGAAATWALFRPGRRLTDIEP